MKEYHIIRSYPVLVEKEFIIKSSLSKEELLKSEELERFLDFYDPIDSLPDKLNENLIVESYLGEETEPGGESFLIFKEVFSDE